MVEFDSLDAATRARENLNGADIYSGCCTLKIDFAKPEKLNVYKNEPDTSWDYTLTTVIRSCSEHSVDKDIILVADHLTSIKVDEAAFEATFNVAQASLTGYVISK
uniref:RRM domain-containing protein n=1 Tax=Glossina morsitans morsitans TaxID=37546 RepID=A0A1B0GA31_GLOMM